MISVSRLAGIRKSSASALALMPASSSTVFNTEPGWIGRSFLVFVAIGMLLPSVIIRDLDIVSISVAPVEAEAKLLVDSDAVLSVAIATELFQAKARKRKIPQRCGRVKKIEFDSGRTFDALEFPARQPVEQLSRLLVLAGSNHYLHTAYYGSCRQQNAHGARKWRELLRPCEPCRESAQNGAIGSETMPGQREAICLKNDFEKSTNLSQRSIVRSRAKRR